MSNSARSLIVFILFTISGATGLVYELIWTRELTFVFGGTTYAITTVLVAFMGGLGLGSYLAGRIADRLVEPARVYGALEALIGLFALAAPWLLGLAEPLYRALYPHVNDMPGLLTAARFAVGALILLLPTTLMGATLPLLVRYAVLEGGLIGRSVALLYGLNTTGAVLGVLLTGFVLIPSLGLIATTRIAAGANILVGLAAWTLLPRGTSMATAARASEHPATPPLDRRLVRLTLGVFALSGFCAMVYQIAWTRTLVLCIGSSTYSFTCILAAFILGLGVGSLLVARVVDRWKDPLLVVGVVQMLIGAAAIAMSPLYERMPSLVYGLVKRYGAEHYNLMVAIELGLVILLTTIPTLLMGMMFPLVARIASRGQQDEAAATGRAYGVNTIGAILGSLLGGFVLIRAPGVQPSILIASVLNAAGGAALLALSRELSPKPAQRAGLGLAGLILVALAAQRSDAWSVIRMNSGAFLGLNDPAWVSEANEVIYLGEGVDLTAIVGRSRSDPESLFLTVNGKTDASTTDDDMTSQLLLGHVPALVVRNLEQSCMIGLGCGVSLSGLMRHAAVMHADCVEISEEVIEAARRFKDFNDAVLEENPHVKLIPADGRNHLLLTESLYDLIISEPSNPWVAGVASLFTVEYFRLCRERLNPDGTLAIWLQGYNMPPEMFRSVVRTLFEVFPYVSLWEMSESDYLMLARTDPPNMRLSEVMARFSVPYIREDLYRVGLGRLEKTLGRFLTSGEPLRNWAASARLHTDDNALLEFTTPRRLHSNKADEILGQLLALRRSPFDEWIQTDPVAAEEQVVVEGTEHVRAARLKRFEATDGPRDLLETIQLVLESARLDPGNPETMIAVEALGPLIARNLTALEVRPGGREALAELQSLPPPIKSVRRSGMTLPILAENLRLLAAALPGERAALRLYLLAEAVDIAPGDVEAAVAFALARAASGAAADASRWLEGRIQQGYLPREAVVEALGRSAEAPGFAELRAAGAWWERPS